MKWEYQQRDVPTHGILSVTIPEEWLDELNRLGSEGWELIRAVPLAVGAGTTERVIFVLKRQVQ